MPIDFEQLKAGGLLTIFLIERGGPHLAIAFDVLAAPDVDKIPACNRSPLLVFNKIVGILVRRKIAGKEMPLEIDFDNLELNVQSLVGHIDRSFIMMQEKWPYEAWLVDQAIDDEESALMGVWPSPVPGGLETIATLMGNAAEGNIVRLPSPPSFFARPMPDPKRSSSFARAMESAMGVRLPSEHDALGIIDIDVHFPILKDSV